MELFSKFIIRPITKNILLTFITEALVLGSFFFVYRLIAFDFGQDEVGQYSLIKRIITFLTPLLLLGFGIGLPRYLSLFPSTPKRAAYLQTGGAIALAATIIFSFVAEMNRAWFALVFFGSETYANLIPPFLLLLVGMIFYGIIYAFLRGYLMVNTFNYFRIITIAILPIAVLILFSKSSIGFIIGLTGIATIVLSLPFLFFLRKELIWRCSKKQLGEALKELVGYSIPRMGGSFAFLGIISLGPILTAHFGLMRQVAYLSLSQNLLFAFAALITPLGLILLPKICNLMSQKRDHEIKANIDFLIGAVIQGSIFITVQAIIFSDLGIYFWLGPEFSAAVPITQIVFSSALFYLFYAVVESILDAVCAKPKNTVNLLISLIVFLTAIGLLVPIGWFSPAVSLAVAFSVAVVCLGSLSYISVREIFPQQGHSDFFYFWTALSVNALLALAALAVKPLLIVNFYIWAIFEMILGIAYLAILWRLDMKWLKEFPGKIMLIKSK